MENYFGEFVVVVSCVTKDQPFRPHPHNIVSKDDCKKGVYRKKFDRPDMTAQLSTLGIQCVKKTEVKESLEQRQKLKIDPFLSECPSVQKVAIFCEFQNLALKWMHPEEEKPHSSLNERLQFQPPLTT